MLKHVEFVQNSPEACKVHTKNLEACKTFSKNSLKQINLKQKHLGVCRAYTKAI